MHLVPPPLVERIIDGSEYSVALTWNAEAVLPALLEALGSSGYLRAQAARFRQSTSFAAKADALRILAADFRVQESLVFHLDPSAAEGTEAALAINSVEPDRCMRGECNAYALDLSGLCAEHLDAEPVARAV
jgi:hypothetical protein